MLSQMSLNEYHHWQAYFRRRPFREAAEWQRHGGLLAFIAGLFTPKGKPMPRASDFIPPELEDL